AVLVTGEVGPARVHAHAVELLVIRARLEDRRVAAAVVEGMAVSVRVTVLVLHRLVDDRRRRDRADHHQRHRRQDAFEHRFAPLKDDAASLSRPIREPPAEYGAGYASPTLVLAGCDGYDV